MADGTNLIILKLMASTMIEFPLAEGFGFVIPKLFDLLARGLISVGVSEWLIFLFMWSCFTTITFVFLYVLLNDTCITVQEIHLRKWIIKIVMHYILPTLLISAAAYCMEILIF